MSLLRMFYTLAIGAAWVSLAACSSTPPPPDWQIDSRNGLERARNAYFSGNQKVYEAEASLARKAVSATGQPELAARLELALCAAQVASLDLRECTGYDSFAAYAAAPERAYWSFLRAEPAEPALLPEQHRATAAALAAKTSPAVLSASEPEAKLISAAVLLRAELASPALIAQAIDTASAAGWRRPLLAWLGLALARAQAANDTAQASYLKARIALAEGPKKNP